MLCRKYHKGLKRYLLANKVKLLKLLIAYKLYVYFSGQVVFF